MLSGTVHDGLVVHDQHADRRFAVGVAAVTAGLGGAAIYSATEGAPAHAGPPPGAMAQPGPNAARRAVASELDQCGVAKPEGVVNVNGGVATEVSGSNGAVDEVTVSPVVMSGGSDTSMPPPLEPPPTVNVSTAIATTALAPSMPATSLNRLAFTSEHPSSCVIGRPQWGGCSKWRSDLTPLLFGRPDQTGQPDRRRV
jgi:hypothetical protein